MIPLLRELAMPAGDPVLASELKALQDDVSTSQRQRRARREAPPAVNSAPAPEAAAAKPAHDAEDATDSREIREQLRELLEEAGDFFKDGEKNIATHPNASVLGALLVGILIGRLLGRR
jgi:hypothetical protein